MVLKFEVYWVHGRSEHVTACRGGREVFQSSVKSLQNIKSNDS